MQNEKGLLKYSGLLFVVIVGGISYVISVLTKSPYLDPLVLSMLAGIIIRTIMRKKSHFEYGFKMAPAIFIPFGVVFYGMRNLNYGNIANVPGNIIILLAVVMIIYFFVVLLLGKILKQRKQITYLVATGSAICGASAIAMTSSAVDAEADDVSISLIAVTVAALLGLFILLPFVAILFKLSAKCYVMLSASVLQFTGFVKAAASKIPYLKMELADNILFSLAVSIKAVRYLGLLIAVPLFASLTKKKIYMPWFLWLFLIAGIIGSVFYYSDIKIFNEIVLPFIKPTYNISWSIAMAAVGLNADIRQLLSNNGTKALIMAFCGFIAALLTFLVGYCVK